MVHFILLKPREYSSKSCDKKKRQPRERNKAPFGRQQGFKTKYESTIFLRRKPNPREKRGEKKRKSWPAKHVWGSWFGQIIDQCMSYLTSGLAMPCSTCQRPWGVRTLPPASSLISGLPGTLPIKRGIINLSAKSRYQHIEGYKH